MKTASLRTNRRNIRTTSTHPVAAPTAPQPEAEFETIFEMEQKNSAAMGFRGNQLVAVNGDNERELTLAESVRFLRDMSTAAEMTGTCIQWRGDHELRKWLTRIEAAVPA